MEARRYRYHLSPYMEEEEGWMGLGERIRAVMSSFFVVSSTPSCLCSWIMVLKAFHIDARY